jgi:hypothetical protein
VRYIEGVNILGVDMAVIMQDALLLKSCIFKGEKYTFKMRSQDVSSLGVHALF